MMDDEVADLRELRSIIEAAGYVGPCEVEMFSAANWRLRPPGEVPDTVAKGSAPFVEPAAH